MRYVSLFQKDAFERRFSEVNASLVVKNAHRDMQNDYEPASPSIAFVMLRRPFDNLWLCRAHEHRAMETSKYVAVCSLAAPGFSLGQLSTSTNAGSL